MKPTTRIRRCRFAQKIINFSIKAWIATVKDLNLYTYKDAGTNISKQRKIADSLKTQKCIIQYEKNHMKTTISGEDATIRQ